MIVNRVTIRRTLSGEPSQAALADVPEDQRGAVLDDLEREDEPTPAGVGLPPPKVRRLEGRASPLSQQARTGRASLLGDR